MLLLLLLQFKKKNPANVLKMIGNKKVCFPMMEMQKWSRTYKKKKKAMFPLELKPDAPYNLEITILYINSKVQRLGY